MGFSNILGEAEIHKIPKIWGKWIPIVRKKYEKTQIFQSLVLLKFSSWIRNPWSCHNMLKVDFHYTGKVWVTFQIYGFLKYFGWSRNPCNSQNMGKVYSHNMGKVWEKNKHSKVMGFSTILGEADIHTIPKI